MFEYCSTLGIFLRVWPRRKCTIGLVQLFAFELLPRIELPRGVQELLQTQFLLKPRGYKMISIQIQVDERLARKIRPVAKAVTKPRVRAIAALCALAIPMTLMAAPVTVPNEFAANTPSSAGDVNENFTALAVGINDNDTRIDAIVASNPTPSAAGVSAYATAGNGGIISSFNSTGGVVTSTTGVTGRYDVSFAGITCVDTTGAAIGIAIANPFVGSIARTCRIRDFTQTGANCIIRVECFGAGDFGLIGGDLALEYKQ